MIAVSPGRLLDEAIVRDRIGGDGASGAVLERLSFDDGSTLVVKSFSVARDWMMRATHDTGRAAELWTSGAADRLPAVIDPAIVRIEHEGDEWRLYLRDVGEFFLRRGTIVDAAEVRRFLDATAAMHRAYWADPPPGLASLRDLIGLASRPRSLARTRSTHRSSPWPGTAGASSGISHRRTWRRGSTAFSGTPDRWRRR